MLLVTLFLIFALIISAVFHEYAHGLAAYKLGDPTAKDLGRLTLNPLAHLDIFGSVILPLLLVFSKSPIFIAWAKPVPFNPYNLKDQKYGELKVAVSGPMMNFVLALFFGFLARVIAPLSLRQELVIKFLSGDYEMLLGQIQGSLINSIFVLSIIFCFINLILMIFNLIPIPPLDGSKILSAFLSYDMREKFLRLEPYGIIIILVLLMFGLLDFVSSATFWLFLSIIGI
ncbi:MAG: site-2 protease family protein [Patescibacteria group bacterium]|nr:site-2 protease family protein [Patescibacteria group bacterium]